MYWQIFNAKAIPMEVWIKKAEIRYKIAATSDLKIDFNLSNTDIETAIQELKKEGKYEVWHDIEVVNTNLEVCSEARVLVHIRNSKSHDLNNF
jgi:hypothetical protein